MMSSYELAYKKLTEHILQGKISPGEKIDQVKLAKEFGLSRTPLREAIRRLQSERLITAQPQKGATIKKLSIVEVNEIYTIRAELESLAVQLTTKAISEAGIMKLLEFRRKFQSSLKAGNTLRWLEDNIDFHFCFAKMCGSTTLFQIIKNLNIRVHKYKHVALLNPEWIKLYSDQHEQIMNYTINKRPLKARNAMKNHLEKAKDNLISYLKSYPFLK